MLGKKKKKKKKKKREKSYSEIKNISKAVLNL